MVVIHGEASLSFDISLLFVTKLKSGIEDKYTQTLPGVLHGDFQRKSTTSALGHEARERIDYRLSFGFRLFFLLERHEVNIAHTNCSSGLLGISRNDLFPGTCHEGTSLSVCE